MESSNRFLGIAAVQSLCSFVLLAPLSNSWGCRRERDGMDTCGARLSHVTPLQARNQEPAIVCSARNYIRKILGTTLRVTLYMHHQPACNGSETQAMLLPQGPFKNQRFLELGQRHRALTDLKAIRRALHLSALHSPLDLKTSLTSFCCKGFGALCCNRSGRLRIATLDTLA